MHNDLRIYLTKKTHHAIRISTHNISGFIVMGEGPQGQGIKLSHFHAKSSIQSTIGGENKTITSDIANNGLKR